MNKKSYLLMVHLGKMRFKQVILLHPKIASFNCALGKKY